MEWSVISITSHLATEVLNPFSDPQISMKQDNYNNYRENLTCFISWGRGVISLSDRGLMEHSTFLKTILGATND